MKLSVNLSVFLFLVHHIVFSQIQTSPQQGFFIAKNNDEISFFRLNLIPSTKEKGHIIKLQERQIFMTDDPNSQAIALLDDYHITTTGDSIIRNVGYGVCINPKTSVNPKLLRYNPGVRLVLFEPKIYENKDDWQRVKSLIKTKTNIPVRNVLNIFWRIPPTDTTNSLKLPFIIHASGLISAKKMIAELMEEFEHAKETSEIRKEISKRFGKKRAEDVYFISVYKNPKEIDKYKFLVVFRIW